jgi:hypothetical protein
MKKLLLLAALLALPSMVFAQGFVTFQNATSPDTRISTNLNGTIGFIDGTNQWVVGLYLAPAGTVDPASANWSLVVTSTNRTGNFRGLFSAYNPLALPGQYAVGTTYATQVRGWNFGSSANANTWDTASWHGASTIGSFTPTAAAPFPSIFGTSAGQVGGFQIIGPVPEPSSIALGLLGLGAVALFRRKK